MFNKNERMNTLNKAGVDTGKYFTVDLPKGLKPGSKITLSINENGEYTFMNATSVNDPILEQIIEDGYVKNTKLYRRFVMAQMFRMLNFRSYDGKYSGYNDYLQIMYGYNYTLTMMAEEVRVLGKLEQKDGEAFDERVHFFNKATVIKVIEDYLVKLEEYVENLPVRKCKGVPYKKVHGVNIFVSDCEKKLYTPVRDYIRRINSAHMYNQIYYILVDFMADTIKLPCYTKKSSAWIDAYKGAGAYYTLKNLIMYHGCKITIEPGRSGHYATSYTVEGTAAMRVLETKLNEYQGDGWRMFALMKKVIEDNHFDFNKRMKEIYSK